MNVINFISLVDPAATKHDIRGLDIVIRLSKHILGCDWPQLTADDESWLKYDKNQMDDNDNVVINFVSPRQIDNHRFDSDDENNEDASSDSDREYLFQDV